jgi:hypothetical protein
MRAACDIRQVIGALGEAARGASPPRPWRATCDRLQQHSTALIKAGTYANSLDMSKAGLYDQLTSEYGEKFTAEEADFAIQHLDD